MKLQENIPVIDLFAGPGGLGEGFASLKTASSNVFDLKLSIEKDKIACETLRLRSFFRKFKEEKRPIEYYNFLRETDKLKKTDVKDHMFEKYSKKYSEADNEILNAELGHQKFPPKVIDKKIKCALNGNKNWVLIGGPPCQAFSLAGRSRVGGISEVDHRVYLYKEYLRIIAKHEPAVFIMENVKGLLSSNVNQKNVFKLMLDDLQDPSLIFNQKSTKRYKIYSLSEKPRDFDKNGHPLYTDSKDFLIKAENYSVPQKRHRVILFGIREDFKASPKLLTKVKEQIKLKDIIVDLPKIRSGINRRIVNNIDTKNNKKIYEQINDTDENWVSVVENYQTKLFGILPFFKRKVNLVRNKNGIGNEFIKHQSPKKSNPLFDWYHDKNLNGVINHTSRSHLNTDLRRYLFATIYSNHHRRFPRLKDYYEFDDSLLPDHKSASSGKFADRFRVQLPSETATTVTSHISKDGHYFIHFDPRQCRSLTVREAARIQTFPDNYFFCGPRTSQYHQVGNAVPPLLALQIAEIVSDVFNQINNK